MEKIPSYKLKQTDGDKLVEMAKDRPELAMPEKQPQFTAEFLSKIGIDWNPEKTGKGFVKLYYHDFIVEEITRAERIVDISPVDIDWTQEPTDSRQVAADLVKQGVDTFEATERIAESLAINASDIKTAGLKDSRATTAQEISISSASIEKIKNVSAPNVFLKNIHLRKGAVETGDLWGNKFTIFIRTNKKDNEKIAEKIKFLQENGFYNFFSLQRFGSRLINTKLGQLIIHAEFEQAVKMFLIAQVPDELLAIRNVRAEAEKYWGDWQKMRQIFSILPYFLRYEIAVLDSLIKNGKYLLALKSIENQTKLFAYAYASFWFNKLLSNYIISGQPVPESLPILSSIPEVQVLYKKIIPETELNSSQFDMEALGFLKMDRIRQVPTRILPKIHQVLILPTGYIFCFSLGKGAYATTLLTEFFDLYQGLPVPEWVDKNRYDIKASLGEMSVKKTDEHFPQKQDETKVNFVQELE